MEAVTVNSVIAKRKTKSNLDMDVEREGPFLRLTIWLWTAKLLPEF